MGRVFSVAAEGSGVLLMSKVGMSSFVVSGVLVGLEISTEPFTPCQQLSAPGIPGTSWMGFSAETAI